MVRKLVLDWRFWAALSLLGIAISGAVLIVTASPGLAGLVGSSLGIVLSLCKLKQERSGNSSQTSSADLFQRPM